MSIRYEKRIPLFWCGPGWRADNKMFVIDGFTEIPEMLYIHIIDDSGTMFDDPDHNAVAL